MRVGLTKRIVSRKYNLVSDYDRRAACLKAWQTRRREGTDKHTEETRERMRQAAIRYISEHSSGVHVSGLEDRVAEELTRSGVPFLRQAAIRNPKDGRYVAVVDFLLSGTVAMEVNGTFWHADPRFFPNGPVFPSQHRTADRYTRKVEALQILGIPLIEVWEDDLNRSMEDTLRTALQQFGLY